MATKKVRTGVTKTGGAPVRTSAEKSNSVKHGVTKMPVRNVPQVPSTGMHA